MPYFNDVRKIFRFWTPSPPCPHLVLICSIEFTQPPLLNIVFGTFQCERHLIMVLSLFPIVPQIPEATATQLRADVQAQQGPRGRDRLRQPTARRREGQDGGRGGQGQIGGGQDRHERRDQGEEVQQRESQALQDVAVQRVSVLVHSQTDVKLFSCNLVSGQLVTLFVVALL